MVVIWCEVINVKGYLLDYNDWDIVWDRFVVSR